MQTPNSEIIIYQNQDGKIKIEVKLEDESVWLTQELCYLAEAEPRLQNILNIY